MYQPAVLDSGRDNFVFGAARLPAAIAPHDQFHAIPSFAAAPSFGANARKGSGR